MASSPPGSCKCPAKPGEDCPLTNEQCLARVRYGRNPPRVLDEILRFASVVEKAPIRLDKQRLCFLVADGEWDELVSYQNTIHYTHFSDNPTGMVSMSVMNIEIVKRSAIAK
jgi:hypothetical protein